MASRVKPRPPYVSPPKVDKSRKRLSRQRRDRLTTDEEYNALRDIYLEQNPACEMCGKPATEVHHIVCGTAGRAASLLNSNTWLGVCEACHRKCESLNWRTQMMQKLRSVRKTIEFLKNAYTST